MECPGRWQIEQESCVYLPYSVVFFGRPENIYPIPNCCELESISTYGSRSGVSYNPLQLSGFERQETKRSEREKERSPVGPTTFSRLRSPSAKGMCSKMQDEGTKVRCGGVVNKKKSLNPRCIVINITIVDCTGVRFESKSRHC